jgi:hypothetical protein
MNEEMVFAAALEKRSATERQAYLDESAAAMQACGSASSNYSLPTNMARAFLDCGLDAARADRPAGRAVIRVRPTFRQSIQASAELGEGGMGEVWVADQIRTRAAAGRPQAGPARFRFRPSARSI